MPYASAIQTLFSGMTRKLLSNVPVTSPASEMFESTPCWDSEGYGPLRKREVRTEGPGGSGEVLGDTDPADGVVDAVGLGRGVGDGVGLPEAEAGEGERVMDSVEENDAVGVMLEVGESESVGVGDGVIEPVGVLDGVREEVADGVVEAVGVGMARGTPQSSI